MQEPNLFREYLDTVCAQIRWKKAHPVVVRELGDHLEDERTALVEAGISEEEAASKAVLDMGDAALVGSQLDRAYRPRPAWGVIAVTAALMIVGFFARIYIVEHVNSIHVPDLVRSVFWLCAAIVVLIAGYFLDYSILGKHPLMLNIGFVVIVIVSPFVMGLRHSGLFYYADYFMILIPIVYAVLLWWWPYQGYGGLISIYLSLYLIVTAALVLRGSMAMFFFAGIGGLMLTAELMKGRFKVRKPLGLIILFGPIALAFVLWWDLWTAVRRRLFYMLLPELDATGYGYQSIQIRHVLENARWFGQGGHPTTYVPDLINNSMLTFFIYQFGWISFVIALLLFSSLIVGSAIMIKKQKSRLGRMVSTSILLGLSIQGIMYIVNNLGFVSFGFPVLPLLSYGNAALLVDSFLIGLMLSVFRNDDVVRDPVIAPKRIPRIRITMERLP